MQTFIRRTLPTLEAEYETLAVAMRAGCEQKSIFSRTGEFEGAEGRVWRFRVQGKVLFRQVG